MKRAFLEYYKCPEGILDFHLEGDLSQDTGYFRLGENTICYGQSTYGKRAAKASDPLADVASAIRPEGRSVLLPFDLTHVV